MGKAYVKSMRMEEKYHECSAAMEGLEASTVWGAQWCNNERAVLRKLVGCKDSGDSLFRKGDYLAAVSSYGAGISLFAQNEKVRSSATIEKNPLLYLTHALRSARHRRRARCWQSFTATARLASWP